MKGGKLTTSSTFRTMAKAFNLQNIQEYRRFLLTAPNITQYVQFYESNNNSNSFQYRIIPESQHGFNLEEPTKNSFDSIEKSTTSDKTTDASIASNHTKGTSQGSRIKHSAGKGNEKTSALQLHIRITMTVALSLQKHPIRYVTGLRMTLGDADGALATRHGFFKGQSRS